MTQLDSTNNEKFEKSYKLPLVNAIPGIVWSIPVHQKLFPDTDSWTTLGLCTLFVAVYVILSMMPLIAAIPCVAGGIMFTALFWVFPDYIDSTPWRIAIKIVILVFFVLIEFCIFANATIPWIDKKTAPKYPYIRMVK